MMYEDVGKCQGLLGMDLTLLNSRVDLSRFKENESKQKIKGVSLIVEIIKTKHVI